jgi:TolA-binding protein
MMIARIDADSQAASQASYRRRSAFTPSGGTGEAVDGGPAPTMTGNGTFRAARAFALSTLAVLPLLSACGGSDDAKKPLTGPVEELYNNGVDALNARRFSTAADQFSAVEQNYPYSTWAVNAQLMSGYSLYLQNKYTDAIGTLDRFIQLHPAHRDIAYAYYLRALCYYEQIADIQRDQKGTEEAMSALGRWCTARVEGDLTLTRGVYAATRLRRTDFGRPAASIRFSTATPMAASVCWPAKLRARSRGPISAL